VVEESLRERLHHFAAGESRQPTRRDTAKAATQTRNTSRDGSRRIGVHSDRNGALTEPKPAATGQGSTRN
jgi:hypothetical protein